MDLDMSLTICVTVNFESKSQSKVSPALYIPKSQIQKAKGKSNFGLSLNMGQLIEGLSGSISNKGEYNQKEGAQSASEEDVPSPH